MSTPQTGAGQPGITYAPLSDIENTRAVDRIESAERESPYCHCGAATTVAVHGQTVWLECSAVDQERGGISGLLARIGGGLGHSRRIIMELPVHDRAA